MPKVYVIPADPSVDPHYATANGLDDYQALVGGWIETVGYLEDVVPYFDEEGKLKGLPANERATAILRESLLPGDFICGDCVFAGFDMETGEDLDIPDEWVASL